mmetsp:Transcript_20346/g.40351  ORF Transcript_20346/g.40351 Transcript_20346/m.40351 type:complete len:969 (-) Transcript_20346:201-3107(-)
MSYQRIPDTSTKNNDLDNEEMVGIPTVSRAPISRNTDNLYNTALRDLNEPSSRTFSAVSFAGVKDFAVDYLFVGATCVAFAAWGGVLFLSEETALAVASLADDDGVIESVQGIDAFFVASFKTSSLFTSPKRLIGLLMQTSLLPIGCGCLGIFALQSYKAVLSVGEAGKMRAPPANSLVYIDEWRWQYSTTLLQAFIALYGLLALAFTVMAFFAGLSFVDGLVRLVCYQEALCSFVLSYQHMLSLDSSGLEQVSSAMGAAYIIVCVVFAGLFAVLAARTLLVRRVVLFKRARSGGSLLGGTGSEKHDMRMTLNPTGKNDNKNGVSPSANENDAEVDDDDSDPFGPPTESEALLVRSSYGGVHTRSEENGYPGSGRSSLPHRHRKNKTKTAVLVLVFIFMFPALFFIALALPDSFSEVSISTLSSDSSSSSKTRTPLPRFFIRHLDLVMFYAYIYLATLFGVLSQFSDGLRRFMLRRSKLIANFAPSFMPFSVSNAQAGLFVLLIGLMSAEGYYYYAVHEFKRMETEEGRATNLPVVLETAARTVGSLCKVVLGFVVLPVVRNSVWCVAFGLNRNSLIRVHQWTGNVFLLLVLAHGVLMAVATSRVKKNPLTAFPSNFTVGLVLAATCLAFVSMGLLARDCVRRAAYEVFLVAHLVTFGIFIIAVLWHADGAWKFLGGGAVLWVADALIRFARATSLVEVCDASLVARGDVLKISYLTEAGGNICAKPSARHLEPLLHGMAQHVFINVPELSKVEWHPFSISSAAEDDFTTHHIKNQGPETFTGRLHALMIKAKDEGRLDKIRLNIDGPYGRPLEYRRYEKIIFVAGGIGITNIHSSFKTLYLLAKAGLLPVTRVHLIWVAKDPAYFDMFADTFFNVSNDSLHTRFKFSFYITQEHSLMGNELYGTQTPTTSKVPFKLGRPNLLRELVGLSAYGMHALINASGPVDLRDTCHRLAIKCGVDYQDETFQL